MHAPCELIFECLLQIVVEIVPKIDSWNILQIVPEIDPWNILEIIPGIDPWNVLQNAFPVITLRSNTRNTVRENAKRSSLHKK